MQFAIGVTILECSFVKHSHGPLGVNFFYNLSGSSKVYDNLLVDLNYNVIISNT
jgi:hypothetical protein